MRSAARNSANTPEIQQYFDWYVEYQWGPWAAAESPRRKTIGRYNQLFSLQQAIASEGAETPLELVWGIGYASWKKEDFATPVKYPLIVQSCEISLNEKTFDLEIRPRDVEPRLEVDCYAEMELPGVKQLEAFWRSALTTGANRVNPFEASTFDGTLKSAVGHLDPSGGYEVRTDDVTPPTPTDKLKITNTWVLFGRKRSGDIFLEDIRRLKKKVEEATTLPSVIRSFVERGDSTVQVRPEQPFRGLSTSDGGADAMELFFPMPYNDEQVSIVQKLHANDGVVVQGPPGTGKTHTIANVICHYLAQGKRVLVTAKGESALAVLQEKLPERIRPLSVALLSDERDGMKQFEHSIQTIASSVASLNPTRAAANIRAAEDKLNQLHAKISHVDRTVWPRTPRTTCGNAIFQGREVTPEEMARLVMQDAELHQWFDDEPPPTKDGMLPFDDADISALRQARMKVGDDLVYVDCSLPATDDFPAWIDLLALHRDLVKAKCIEASVTHGSLLALVDSRLETFEKAQALVKFLDDRMALKMKLASAKQPWLDGLGKRFADMQPGDPVLKALFDACGQVRRLEQQRRELVAKAVDVPANAEANPDFGEAIARLIAGKSAFSLPFGKGDARKLVAAVKVKGASPTSRSDWELVQETLEWRAGVRKVLARWNALVGEFGLESAAGGPDAAFKRVAQCESHIDDVRRMTFEFDANLHARLEEVLGKHTADRMWDGGEQFVALAFTSLTAHVDKSRLGYAMQRVQELLRKLEGHSGKVVEQLRAYLAESLGSATSDEAILHTTWLALQAELARLNSLRPALNDIARVADAIEAAGAAKWARRVRAQPAGRDADAMLPASWLDAWNWRQAAMFLDQIDGHQALRKLFEDRKTLTTALARTYQDLVAEKTWLGVFNNSPDSVRQALQRYLNAVQAMGAGTGVRAVRHRKTARDAMRERTKPCPAGCCRSGGSPKQSRRKWGCSTWSSSTRHRSPTSGLFPPCCAARRCSSSATTSRCRRLRSARPKRKSRSWCNDSWPTSRTVPR